VNGTGRLVGELLWKFTKPQIHLSMTEAE